MLRAVHAAAAGLPSGEAASRGWVAAWMLAPYLLAVVAVAVGHCTSFIARN